MFAKILVPLDLADTHAQALEAAGRLARESGGAVTLLHVVRLIPGLDVADEESFYAGLHRKTREHLGAAARTFEAKGVRCAVEVRFGDPAREIVRFCHEAGTDLVVLDSHRIDGPGQPGWGTLSYKVGVLSPCPVLLVK